MSNCLFFAIRRWMQKGGYVIFRKSRFGWWPHFLWSPDLRDIYEYVPLRPKRRRIFPPIVFRGRVKHAKVDNNSE